MARGWPMVPLSELLTKSDKWITLEPSRRYREVTVRMWGKGVVLRREVSGAEIAGSKRLVVHAGQFILSRIDARNGALGLVPEPLEGAVVSGDFPAFTVNADRLDPRYLESLARTAAFVDLCRAASEGTTNRVRLKEGRFLATRIPLPPLAEQRRIVARVGELAGKINEAQRLRRMGHTQTDTLVQSVRARLFERGATRGTVRLGKAAVLERGRFSHRPRNDPHFFGGRHPWIQIAEIEASQKHVHRWTQTLNDEGLAISRKFPRGTVLVSIAATIGAVGILDFDCCIPDSIVAVTPRTGFCSDYIYHFLCHVRTHLELVAPQSAQKNINLRVLSQLSIPVLSIEEQRRVVGYLDSLEGKVDALRRLQSETAAELDALPPAVLEGALRGGLCLAR